MSTICHSRAEVNVKKQWEEDVSRGILSLISKDKRAVLMWTPLVGTDLLLLKALGTPSNDLLPSSAIEYCWQIELDSISCIQIQATLTMFQEKAVAIPLMLLEFEGGEKEFWFDPLEGGGVLSTSPEVLLLLKSWIRPFGRDLKSFDGNKYYITDEMGVEPSRWPKTLPQPAKDSPFFKIGEMGLDLLSQVLGSNAKDKIEDVGFNVLENFAQVTHFAKEKTSELFKY
jgi:hypothetical protein